MPIGEADNFALVCQLFAREVPEIASGAIAVRAVARAPGRRTKVALTSRDRDPIGPCVGPKGLHAKVIAAELGGEPIDMISWSESPHEFVRRALAPA